MDDVVSGLSDTDYLSGFGTKTLKIKRRLIAFVAAIVVMSTTTATQQINSANRLTLSIFETEN